MFHQNEEYVFQNYTSQQKEFSVNDQISILQIYQLIRSWQFLLVLNNLRRIYNLIEYQQMENKSLAPNLTSSRSQNILKKYHQMTSPLVSLQSAKKQDFMKDQLRQNVTMKLDCIKNRGSKIYALDSNISYSELKAGAALYQIPQFSVPEVNFEVSDQIRKKVDEAKKEIISYLPQISRSSNYAPKKLEHQLNHRSAVRELEEWLNDKLKNPPSNSEESIEYKNMIMGVGMKQLIRIIGKRCSEQGRMAEQIWELTWSICRQIILYLSKRAKKCQQLLEEELMFMRTSYEKEFERLNLQNSQFAKKIINLEEQNKQYLSQLVKIRKRKLNLEQENKSLTFGNYHLQNQFKKVLEQNLAIYLQIGDKSKRGWIKKMYKKINALPLQVEKTVTNLFKKEVAEVIEERTQYEEITDDCQEKLDAQQIQLIGNNESQKIKKRKEKKKKKIRKQKGPPVDQNTLITAPQEALLEGQMQEEEKDKENIQSEDDDEEEESLVSCAHIINNMHEQFLSIDTAMQTEAKMLVDAYASTYIIEFMNQQTRVTSSMLGFLEQIGVNTDEIKQQQKPIKKKGKQNTKEQSKTKSSKIYNISPSKQKSKPKFQKQKKNIIDTVQTSIGQEQIKVQENLDNNSSFLNEQINIQNNRISIVEGKPQQLILNMTQKKATTNKKSVLGNLESLDTASKTNSFIISQSNAVQLREKIAQIHQQQSSKKSKRQIQPKKKNEDVSPSSVPSKSLQKQEVKQKQQQKHNYSMSFDEGSLMAKQNHKRSSKLGSIDEYNMYICAQCNKIITSLDEKFEYPKIKNNYEKIIYEQKRLSKASAIESKKKFSPQDEDTFGLNVRKGSRQNSSYLHDIAYKKDMEDQEVEQQKKPSFFKGNYNKNETYESYGTNNEAQQGIKIYNKVSPIQFFLSQLIQGNKSLVQGLINQPQQVSQNLEHYFQMVRQINSLSENKINLTEKSTISVLEKNIFPILSQLIISVKKTVKFNKVAETIKNFTSLPNIVYNRITRKYGVKILAIKNLKIVLMALKNSSKYSQKYKILQLMMFTDCKSPHSEDLFIYLFIMALHDPLFSSNKLIKFEQAQSIRKLCEDYLTKQNLVYQQFDTTIKQIENKQDSNIPLSNLIKGIITNYRLLKINRIEEVGFIFLMLKKDHQISYKKFIYFLSTLNIGYSKKIGIAKKLLKFCDIKSRQQKVGISEIMFSKFLMNCQDFNFSFLEETINLQLQHLSNYDKDIVNTLSSKFFKTQRYIKTKYDFKDELSKNQTETVSPPHRESIDVQANESTNKLKGQNFYQDQPNLEHIVENVTVMKKVKQYSSFTYNICQYLQNTDETKYLTYRQHLFIKNYLIVHIIESQIEKTIGLADYFSNSMLETICMPVEEFNIDFGKKI